MLTRRREGRTLRAGPAGIALVEVLVSLSIIGIGLGSLLRTTSVCVRSQARAEDRGVARRLAEAKAIDAREALAKGGTIPTEGSFAAPHTAYEWTAVVEPPRGDMPFSLLTVGVSRQNRQLYRLQVPVVRPER